MHHGKADAAGTPLSQRDLGPYRVLSTREVYRNPWFRLREDHVIRPGGGPGMFAVVEMKTGSSVLAVNRDREVYLVREYKYGIERDSLEVISGGIDEGESPLQAAERELEEEGGLRASEWVDLGRIDPFTTAIHSPNYLFLALDATETGRQQLEQGEVLELVKLPYERALEMAIKSEITHAASCVLLLKAQPWLR
jgi:8-oxo-dGTP pyrophosphatase MutT (NUDIX family)